MVSGLGHKWNKGLMSRVQIDEDTREHGNER